MRDMDFYQPHLDRVSRSFAFCIRELDGPFRPWVALSYLLFRLLDTIEDAPWIERRPATTPGSRPAPAPADDGSLTQLAQFADFDRFIEQMPAAREVHAWAARFPDAIPAGEKLLLQDAFHFFEDLHSLPLPVRSKIQHAVLKMAGGMRHYSLRAGQSGGATAGTGQSRALRLTDLRDVNRYCYFVAGLVGELLTELFLAYRSEFKPSPHQMHDAVDFGLFLQKINLLKDQRTDEREGRFLVPDRQELLASLTQNAQGAMRYLTALPADEKGFRTFCAWSLFLGAASLPWIEKSYQAENSAETSGIPRTVTQALLAVVKDMAQDNEALWEAFNERCSAPFGSNTASSAEGPQP